MRFGIVHCNGELKWFEINLS